MDFAESRLKLVDSLEARGYLSTKEIIRVFQTVRREYFVPEDMKDSSYVDRPLPIGSGQTISAPHMVAIMTEALDAKPKDRILEVGAGSGYQAAILAQIVKEGEIYTIERIPELAAYARRKLEELGYQNTHVVVGDGTKGLIKHAPFDRIIVTCGAPKVPKALTHQLAEGGRLLIPVGGKAYQELISVEKQGDELSEKNLGSCVFVPLIGEDGW